MKEDVHVESMNGSVPPVKRVFEDYLVSGSRWKERDSRGESAKEVTLVRRVGRFKLLIEDVHTLRRSQTFVSSFQVKYGLVPPELVAKPDGGTPPTAATTANLAVVPSGAHPDGEVDVGAQAFTFEGHRVPMYLFQGRLCMIAADAGQALGYGDDGKDLPNTIGQKWEDEMILGRDYDVFAGSQLRDFKALSEVTAQKAVSANARHVMVLYEPGWDLVCTKTDKPQGKKLRRFLVDHVMPKLRRGEPVLPQGAQIPAVLKAEPPIVSEVPSIAVAMLAALVERVDVVLTRQDRLEQDLTGFEVAVEEQLARLTLMVHRLLARQDTNAKGASRPG